MAFSMNFPIDAATGLIKRAAAQAAVTTSGYVGTQHDQGAATLTDGVLVVNVEAVDIASNDEFYAFRVVASNVSDRSDGVIVAERRIGKAAGVGTGHTVDAAAGDRLVIPFRTEYNRTAYRYIDLYLLVGGTTPSVTFNAYISKDV